MINVTDTIEQAYEQSTTQYDKIILDNEEYAINSVDYGDDCYDEGNIFGTAIARSLDFEIDSNIDLEKKEFKYLTGIKTSVGIEWIDLGTFIIQDIEPNETTGITKVNAMDYMLKSNIAYKSELDYSSGNITILQVLQEACQQAGLTLATTDFANNTFIVDSNQFDENTLIRQVIQAVAQISGTFAKIKNDDKLYLITPKKAGLTVAQVHKMLVKDLNALPVNKLIGVDPDARIKMSDYSELVCKRNTHPINLVSLGMSDVEGENVVMRDEESIAEDGENSLVINDNPFAYTEAKRQQLITALFNKVKGFEYTSFEIIGQSKPFLETGDEILVVDKDNTFLSSFLFRFNCKSPNGLESEMSAPSLTKATVEYQNIASAEQVAKRTELRVDKQEQTITGIIEQQTETENKLTKVEQDVDGITQTVSSVETKIETVEDKAEQAQTSANTANTNAQNAQHAANNAQNTANSAVSQIETTTEKLAEVEQSVDGFTQTVSSIEAQIETIDSKADSAQDSADEAISKAETTTEKVSQIEQTVEGITQTVDDVQTNIDENYSTTEQMNSAIEQKAGSITSSVSESIENIQVGGTNLIPNSAPFDTSDYYISDTSSIELTLQNEETAPYRKCLRIRTLKQLTSTSGIYIYMTKDTLEEGKEYCFSIWLKATANTIVTTGYNAGGSTSFNVTTSWRKFTHKFTATATSSSKVGFPIYLPVNTIEGRQVFVHSIKLEEGNKVTAWSPAPEDDVKGFEFGTKIEQNSKYVQYAWNNESQNIKIENDNGNSTMGFYDNDTKFAEMGVNNVDNDRYISFGIPVNYGQNIQDGMAWGMQTPDGKFWPILYIKDFHMANKDAGDFSGNLVLEACNLLLEGINSAITCGNINITNAGVFGGVMFEDANTHQNLLTIMPFSSGDNSITILDKISFYKNSAGTNTLIIGLQSGEHCMMTDDGYFSCREVYSTGDISCSGNIKAFNHIYCNNGVEPFSLAEKKRDIEKYNNKALDEVLNTDIYYYNYKEDAKDIKRRVGAIIGEDYKCSKEIVGTEGKGIDIYSMLSLSYKAIQEQQELIEKQNNTIKDLQDRIEKLEQKVGVANE
mgnify:CR=1 FL=1